MSAVNGHEPQPQQGGVPPSVVPLAWAVQPVPMADGVTRVMVQVQSPVGVFVMFFSAKDAMAFGAAISKTGRESSSGLILPGGLN